MTWTLTAGAYWLAISLVTFAAFGHDKSLAQRDERRMSEADLLFLALIGGSVGAFVGRRHFRHKTRKQPFSTQLQVIAMLQAGVLGGLAFAFAPIG